MSNPFGIKTFAEEDNMYSVKSKTGRLLKPEYDAARQNMGGEWSLPTRVQCNELCENCYVKYVKVNGVEGSLFTSRKNGKSVFLPFTDNFKGLGGGSTYMTANSGRIHGMFLYWWGCSYSKDDNSGICIFENNTYMHNEDELGGVPAYLGLHIRAVWGGKDNISSKSDSGKKSKMSDKKSSDDSKDSKDSGQSKDSKKESATKTLKKIGKGIGKLLK